MVLQGECGTETVDCASEIAQRGLIPERSASSITHGVAPQRQEPTSSILCASPSSNQPSFALSTRTQPPSRSSLDNSFRRNEAVHSLRFIEPLGHMIRSVSSTTNQQFARSSRAQAGTNNSPLRAPCFGQDVESFRYSCNSPSPLTQQRLRIRRHLRLIYIYPLVYTPMWLLPLVHHCMMYIDNYAQDPLWPLRLGATICICSMGFVDCFVFFLREKPWRSITSSDGTFWGSFITWNSNAHRGQEVNESSTSNR